jgi:hypothetical protein
MTARMSTRNRGFRRALIAGAFGAVAVGVTLAPALAGTPGYYYEEAPTTVYTPGPTTTTTTTYTYRYDEPVYAYPAPPPEREEWRERREWREKHPRAGIYFSVPAPSVYYYSPPTVYYYSR